MRNIKRVLLIGICLVLMIGFVGCEKDPYKDMTTKELEQVLSDGLAERSGSEFVPTIDKFYSESDSTIVEGKIKNNFHKTAYFIKVKASFKDDAGNVIDTESGYAVSDEGIKQGESSSYKIYVNYDKAITKCSVEVYDFELR